MEYMEQKMDDQISAGIHLEEEMSELVEKVEEALHLHWDEWNTIDPRKLVYTIINTKNNLDNPPKE